MRTRPIEPWHLPPPLPATMYLIGFVTDGKFVDVMKASEYPVSQIYEGRPIAQVLIHKVQAPSLERANLMLIRWIETANLMHNWLWVLRMPTLAKQLKLDAEMGRCARCTTR